MSAEIKANIITAFIILGAAISLGVAISYMERTNSQVQIIVCARETDMLHLVSGAYLENLYETGELYAWKRHEKLIKGLQTACADQCSDDIQSLIQRMKSMKQPADQP